MSGVLNLFGWQWMFAIEGAPAVVLGLLSWRYLVDKPRDASWLTQAEKDRLVALCAQGQVVPNAIGAVGLILIARRSDRTGERRKHFAFCTVGGGLALAALTLHLSSFPAMLAILSLAAVLIFAALPIFWAVPTSYLSGKAAASGIAFISSIGITSGIVSPWVIGQVHTTTGSMDLAVYLLAGLLVVSGVALMVGVKADLSLKNVLGQ
jgi:hypothetical protein